MILNPKITLVFPCWFLKQKALLLAVTVLFIWQPPEEFQPNCKVAPFKTVKEFTFALRFDWVQSLWSYSHFLIYSLWILGSSSYESKVNQVHKNVACCWILQSMPGPVAGASQSHTGHDSLKGCGRRDLQTARRILRKRFQNDLPFIFLSRAFNVRRDLHTELLKRRHQKHFPSW